MRPLDDILGHAAVSKAGTKHLCVIAFEAEEARTCVLSPEAYFASSAERDENSVAAGLVAGPKCQR